MKPRKKTGLFDQIHNRELTGRQVREVCYVALVMPKAVSCEMMKEFLSGKYDKSFLLMQISDAQETFRQADEKPLQRIQLYFNERAKVSFATTINELILSDRLTSQATDLITKSDLCERAYWILTMKGSVAEINDIKAKGLNNAKGLSSVMMEGFGQRILAAKDNSGKYLFTRANYSDEQENKQENPPAIKNNSERYFMYDPEEHKPKPK